MSSLARTTFVYVGRWPNVVTDEAANIITEVGWPAEVIHAACCERCGAVAEEEAAGDKLAEAIEDHFGPLAARGYLLLTELHGSLDEAYSAGNYGESNQYVATVTRTPGTSATYKIGLSAMNTMQVEDVLWWLLPRQEPLTELFTPDEVEAIREFAFAWLVGAEDWWAPEPVAATA